MSPSNITGIVLRMSSIGVKPAIPETAMITPEIGLIERAKEAESCTGITNAMVL